MASGGVRWRILMRRLEVAFVEAAHDEAMRRQFCWITTMSDEEVDLAKGTCSAKGTIRTVEVASIPVTTTGNEGFTMRAFFFDVYVSKTKAQ
jgi:hypothetical protein